MRITSATPRRHTVNIANDSITLYHRTARSQAYDAPVHIRNIYAEFSRSAMERRYGLGSGYKALIVMDSTQPYVNVQEDGFFLICIGDKIVDGIVDDDIETAIRNGRKLYEVRDVSEYTVRGELLSVEVLCG